jgi:hypothetical protein
MPKFDGRRRTARPAEGDQRLRATTLELADAS